MINQKIILIATANPDNSGQVRTDRFVSAIQKGLTDAEKSNEYAVVVALATDLDNLNRELEKKKPHILVIVGHGDSLDRFVFETTSGGKEFAKPDPFAKTLGLYSKTLECVLVMSCHSKSLAMKITQYIPYAVGYDDALQVGVAKDYVEKFFFYLACGNDYNSTDSKTRTTMQNEIPESQIPLLFQKDKVVDIDIHKTTKSKDMTYLEFQNFTIEASMLDIFNMLDAKKDLMDIDDQLTYASIKKEYQDGETTDKKLKSRLLVLSKKFLAQHQKK